MQENTTLKKWNIMLYLAGDNDLSDEMIWTLTELFRTELPSQIAVSVQFDPVAKGSPTRFYRIHAPIHPLIDVDGAFRLEGKDEGEVNDGSLNVLARFIRKSVKHEAENYALILSGHGSGIDGDFLTDLNPGSKSLPSGSLKITELGKILDTVKQQNDDDEDASQEEKALVGRFLDNGIDVVGMDSCLMSMAEVACEIKHIAKYLVGSEGYVQKVGWPYYRLFGHLRAAICDPAVRGTMPSLSNRFFATAAVHRCANYYADYHDADISFDIAACELSKIDTVQKEIKTWVDCIDNAGGTDTVRMMYAIQLAHWKAQSYKWDLYVDVWDFFDWCHKICETFNCAESDLSQLMKCCENVQRAVEAAVVCHRFVGPGFQYSRGVSIYFPWSKGDYAPDYKHNKFAKNSRWDHFLSMYFSGTMRAVQNAKAVCKPGDPYWKKYVFETHRESADNPRGGLEYAIAPPASVRLTPPSQARLTPPSQARTTPPYGRIGEYLEVIEETLSVMKNVPDESEDILMLSEDELAKLP
jgi:hypothetical protein